VSVLGIDGLDKKAFMAEVAARCAAAGLSVRQVSWQGVLADADRRGQLDEYPYNELQRLWQALFPVFFGDARADGRRLDEWDSPSEPSGEDYVRRVRPALITGMRPAFPLATSSLEMAGHTLLHHSVVYPLMADGHVVIQNSLGVKNVIKSLFMAEFAAPEQAASLASMRRSVREYFGVGLSPVLGVYLKEDPAAVVNAKGAANLGIFDSFRLFGGDPVRTFAELQARCAAEFEEFASEYGWLTVDFRDASAQGRAVAADQLAAAIVTAAVDAAGAEEADGSACS